MSTELMKVEQTKVTDAELTSHLENMGLLKDLTNGEKNSYLQIAKAFNLNPFKREIHVSKYNGQMSIITGYEVYIKRAERTGQLDGWSVTTDGNVKDNSLKAVVTIHRKDRSHPFVWEAIYAEYVQLVKDKDNNQYRPNKFWQKATTMIKKVAISQAFRLCFSDELGGMPYTADEIQTEDVQAEITTKPEPPNHNQKELDSINKWSATDAMFTEANALVNDSTLDANQRVTAYDSLANAKSEKEWVKIINRLRELQIVPV